MADLAADVADLKRRVARMIQTGVIVEADYEAARVRVAIDQRTSPWLPWATRRAGSDVDWWAPEVGEQVEVLAPNGELNAARVIPAFYSDEVPAPAASADIRLIRFGNGTEIRHDRARNQLSIDTPDDVTIHAAGTADVAVDGDTKLTTPQLTVDCPDSTFTGNVTIKGLLAYQGGMTGKGGSGATAAITGRVDVTQGDVTANGISLEHHTHPGDSGGTTGEPNG
ncbi:phage baseplate assembly protein V [Salinisphaera orenii]|uniref:phage baseplate assembly protein V n=1 Tax=Salinisphaera orenii TaxID=856731 RepID=UPI000DBE7C61